MSQFLKTYPAFRSHDFKLYFLGQSISFAGTWLQVVTQAWLMFQLTHSAFATGLTGFLGVLPVVVIAPLGGAIVDRASTRTVLVVTGLLGVLQATGFGLLYLSGHATPFGIYAFALAWGIVNGFDTPARFTCIREVVGSDLLASANALNSTLVGLGFIAGPSIAGIIIAKVGIGTAFFVNAVSFIPMILLLFFMNLRTRKVQGKKGVLEFFRTTWDGILFCAKDRAIGPFIGAMGIAVTFGSAYKGIFPVIANIIHLGPKGFGWLSATPGIGALLGAMFVSRVSKNYSPERSLFLGICLLAGSLVMFSVTRNFIGVMALCAGAGFGLEVVVINVQSATAILAGPKMIGRVMGCGASVFFFGTAMGYLGIGYVADHFGAFPAIGWSGVTLIPLGVMFYFKRYR